jgi:HSP20 family molecular chaperone IbpA
MSTALTTFRPGLLGSRVFDDVFDSVFMDFPRHLKQSTQGYPVADIYSGDNGSTVLEFALAGFGREELSVDIRPDKRSITVSANSNVDENDNGSRRIARRNFTKTYVNYDNNLDLAETQASFENGLLTVTVPPRAETQAVSVSIS